MGHLEIWCHRLGIVMLRIYGALAHVLGPAIESRSVESYVSNRDCRASCRSRRGPIAELRDERTRDGDDGSGACNVMGGRALMWRV